MKFDIRRKKKKKNVRVTDNHTLMSENAPFAVKESFGLLRTNLIYTPYKGEGAPVFGITSAGESSGKSTIIANLAYSFAHTGKKVVLIDADMRCPVQQNFFGYKKFSTGLSEILSGIVKSKNEVIINTEFQGLDVISSGHVPPNPSELILSPRFGDLISELKAEYDYVFIDFPPIGIVADAASVVSYVSGYIFVIRANVTDIVSVKEALETLENIGATIVGTVLNDVNYKDGMFGDKYRKSRYGKYGKYGKYSKYSKYDYSRYEMAAKESADTKKEEIKEESEK